MTAKQEVAWQVEVYVSGTWSPMGNPQRDKTRAESLAGNPSIPIDCIRIVPLYTTPQQRTAAEGEDTRRAWVGLTDEDLAVCGDEDDVMLARYWERVCKEKQVG